MRPDPYDYPTRRLAVAPRHSATPGGRHRAVVMPGWFRVSLMAFAIWWFAIGGIV
jgi:hypothetical protein